MPVIEAPGRWRQESWLNDLMVRWLSEQRPLLMIWWPEFDPCDTHGQKENWLVKDVLWSPYTKQYNVMIFLKKLPKFTKTEHLILLLQGENRSVWPRSKHLNLLCAVYGVIGENLQSFLKSISCPQILVVFRALEPVGDRHPDLCGETGIRGPGKCKGSSRQKW